VTHFEPELGQFAHGCPYNEFAAPEFIEAGLNHLATEIERVEWNVRQEEYRAPVANTGDEYETPDFKLRAYYWGDCTCGAEDSEIEKPHAAECGVSLPNFKCGDFEVRWYKWLGRGMSMIRQIDANEFFQLIDKCVESVRRKENEHYKDDQDYH
jgi:hypothetical protein